ncbi:hypothetical protein EDB84DRAFT_1432955 [Lactarius hengduanensis]|nr:hypothetical protein EDB84DRAFT_1432955 [Lactarius hengduanensis]
MTKQLQVTRTGWDKTLCGRLIRQEGLPYVRHPALAKPGVGRATLPRARARAVVPYAAHRTRLGNDALKRRGTSGRATTLNVVLARIETPKYRARTQAQVYAQAQARTGHASTASWHKWYTNALSKVSAENYKIGTNSGNIIVQNRMTGLEEENTQVYARTRYSPTMQAYPLEGFRARKLLKSLSVKQGIKYDSPESARDIPAFIQFYKLNGDEILGPLPSFHDQRGDKIKGSEFAIPRLLGDAHKDLVERYAAALSSSSASHRRNRRARAWAKVVEQRRCVPHGTRKPGLGARKAALGDDVNGKEDRLPDDRDDNSVAS